MAAPIVDDAERIICPDCGCELIGAAWSAHRCWDHECIEDDCPICWSREMDDEILSRPAPDDPDSGEK